MFNWKFIKYTWEHKKAFLVVEKRILGYNTLRGYLHDVDKLVMYPFLPKRIVSSIHRRYSHHHIRSAKTENDFIEMLVDWECARYTKADKQLDAYDTLYAFYPQLEHIMLPLIAKYRMQGLL